MIDKKAKTSVEIHDLIAARWSPRALSDKPVEMNKLTALLEAARWAPSCFGDEPWRFVVWNRDQDAAAHQQAFELLAEANRAWAEPAPVLILACADSEFTANGKPNRWGQYDTGAAAENLCLQASSEGLVAHQMGGFDRKHLRKLLGIPERFELMAMIAVGYPGDPSYLPEAKQEAEAAERKRSPLGSRFFAGAWEAPYDS
ncbi:MAG: nitroreductase family protein [Gammaproteobacteria bacterium]|nr:nitroreductase family protein [Gammaproteobacteria bacterium]